MLFPHPIQRLRHPEDADAIIYVPARSAMMSAPKRKEEGKLQFESRSPLCRSHQWRRRLPMPTIRESDCPRLACPGSAADR
jgi:hypothetical protein